MIQMYNRLYLQTLTNITLERWLETILTLLSSAQKLSRFFSYLRFSAGFTLDNFIRGGE
jgi:hypothetical protein